MNEINRAAAIKQVCSIPIQLTRFSHWPLMWHIFIFPVLQIALEKNIRTLYIKVKFGSLRIQGDNIGTLLPWIEDAESKCLQFACVVANHAIHLGRPIFHDACPVHRKVQFILSGSMSSMNRMNQHQALNN